MVKTNESRVILRHAGHTWKPSAPGSSPTGWTVLDLTYGNMNCLMLRFPAPHPTKRFQALRHIRLRQIQLIH
jgi:hypothetical protein